MREIAVAKVSETVAELYAQANLCLPADIAHAMGRAQDDEQSPVGRSVLADLRRNADEAKRLHVPVCQDTGMAVVFLDLGQNVHLTGGPLKDAVNEGVRLGTQKGYLRCSVVGDPLERINTGDNTPAVLHVRIVEGDRVRVTVAPKGFGSENMSRIRMFTPAATREELIAFVAESVSLAGSKPCPPVVVGVGIGGDFELCAELAKRALCRPLDVDSGEERYRALERDMLEAVNRTGIGPQGFGGTVTALKVQVEHYATHIAGLPVAVNMGCHVTRHSSAEL